MAELKYRRILLKLGGEALAGEGGFGINPRQAAVCGATRLPTSSTWASRSRS